MYRYDNYTDSFIRIDGEPNTGSTTVRVGVPIKEAVIVEKTELTDECIDKIADAVVQKFADRKTEPQTEDKCKGCIYENGDSLMACVSCQGKVPYDGYEWDEPQTDCSWQKGE